MSKSPPSEKLSFKGLSPADLVVLFAYHGGKEQRPCFYRDQIWLNWAKEGATEADILERWMNVPERTRIWVAPGHARQRLTKVSYRVEVARKERADDWVLRPDREETALAIPLEKERAVFRLFRENGQSAQQIGDQVGVSRQVVSRLKKRGCERSRSFGCWLRNRLWLNWHDHLREQGVKQRVLKVIAEKWARLPADVRGVLDSPAHRFASRGDIRERPRNCTFNGCIRKARRLRDGKRTEALGPGSLRRRRRLWLELAETGVKPREIPDDWNRLSDEERLDSGGPRGCQKLPVKRGKKGSSTKYVRTELWRALWEREIEGNPPLYGQGLWFLKQPAHWNAQQRGDAWDLLSYRHRTFLCPDHPERLPSENRARRNRVQGAMRLAKNSGAAEFLASLKSFGERFGSERKVEARCTARNELFCEIRETRWEEAGKRFQGVVRLCKGMTDDELLRRGVAPKLIRDLPEGPRGARIVASGIYQFKRRGDNGNRKTAKPRPNRVTPTAPGPGQENEAGAAELADTSTKEARKGGRRPKWKHAVDWYFATKRVNPSLKIPRAAQQYAALFPDRPHPTPDQLKQAIKYRRQTRRRHAS